MSELFDKEVNAQKESLKKTSGVHVLQAHEVCDENERKKNVIDGGKHFIGHIRKTGENDLDKLRDTILHTMKVPFV